MKNKKITRSAGFLMVTVLLASAVLSGCGSNVAKTDTATPGTSTQAPTTDNKTLAPVNLTWYVVGTPQKDQQVVTDAINKILKEKINTTLTINTIDWGAYDQKMNVIVSSGEPYDLAFTSSWANNYTQNVSKGALLPLDDLLQKYGKHILEQVPEKYWPAAKVNGKTYGVLNYQIYAIGRGLNIKKDLADKYTLDTSKIKKYADITPFLDQVKQGESGVTPFLATGNITNMYDLSDNEKGMTLDQVQGNSVNPLGVHFADKSLKVFDLVESPEFMAQAKMFREWYQKGYIRKDAASLKDAKAEGKTGKYAVMTGGYGPGSEAGAATELGYPVVQGKPVPQFVNTGAVIAAMTGINKNSKNPERAMMLLDLLFSDKDLYNLFTYGIEGTHYTKVDANTVEIVKDSAYNPSNAWEFGSWFNAYVQKGQPADTWEQMKKANNDSVASPLLGFLYNADAMKKENAQINAIMNEYLPIIYTGTQDPEKTVPELVNKLKAAGLDAMITDAQKQIDDWKAANGK
ncbi:ABC transporter substrate-binding protein [Paenibacillus aceris]|uniref:Aldouronate transport system substrate-binding protein n=1 Tax=Paenibacillus aceris TaxID=869555 RepID=A0ABS4I4I4_9BACL|nr:ABC transporter substrate-binding protein [Paenibacillus aceris]MBP1965316.1 putative aldouronate transport system substrate-binding protein [Paenibacillus aceris]NHW35998.1 ABC transporter substrate-binding protein [Paenibacillus aceris]